MSVALALPTTGDRRLGLAIAVSLLLHALILSLHFTFPDASQAVREKALDIILVNARSRNAPAEAQALAQANLDGGGNTDDNRRAKTPLPSTSRDARGDELMQMQRRVQELEAAQQRMLTQAQSQARVTSAERQSEQPVPAKPLSGQDLADAARAMARLEEMVGRMARFTVTPGAIPPEMVTQAIGWFTDPR